MQNMLAVPGIITEVRNESLCVCVCIYIYSIQEILFLVLLLKVRKREKKVAILSPSFILCTLFVKTCNETQALRKNN